MLPPYETADTLARLERDIDATGCDRSSSALADSFDDPAASADLDSDTSGLDRKASGRARVDLGRGQS